MRAIYAARAARAYVAMQHRFHTPSGRYRRDGRVRIPGVPAHLWPFARALVATLDLAGIGDGLVDGIDFEAEISDRLEALEAYWDSDRLPPAYSSDVRGSRLGGDRYYDDNAWVGLALVQHARMYGDSGYLDRAEELFRFAQAGWAEHQRPNPGGVFWVEQGRGVGVKNHDRNTVSTAPNAQLGMHAAELQGRSPGTVGGAGAHEMYEWVLATLDASHETDTPGTGLFADKIRGDGTIDRTLWSYNQGSMVAVNVLLARDPAGAPTEYLARAEAIARKALRHFAGGYERQPPAFNAIFFRCLLLLHHATEDARLRDEIIDAIRGYVDRAWSQSRDRRDRFTFVNDGVTLLNQSAMVQLLALLAWEPSRYGLLA
ncbi:MAG: hypothetical protein JO168_16135 [Solirubrobacterales bacterium]|nr:hypothetical protein [Solirubrobacterales bacterium]MBV9717587.1 hypothetical protein [Solirubrobacterales bacterium]